MRKVVKETIQKTKLPIKSFKLQLKELEKLDKDLGWVELKEDERKEIFGLVDSLIEDKSLSNTETYNIFNLANYLIWDLQKAEDYFEVYIDWFLWSVEHPYKKIREFGISFGFYLYYIFEILTEIDEPNDDVKIKNLEPKSKYSMIIVEMFLKLQDRELEYQDTFYDKLAESDIFSWYTFVDIDDTKDVILKNIRMAMFVRDTTSFQKIMEFYKFEPLLDSSPDGEGGGRYLPQGFKDEVSSLRKEKEKQIQKQIKKISSPEKLEKEKQKIKKAYELFAEDNILEVSFSSITDIVYTSDMDIDPQKNEYYLYRFDLCEKNGIEMSQNIFDLITSIRNFFPHKWLDNKAPIELLNESNNS